MSEVVINCRIEPELKADAEAVLHKLSLSVSDVMGLTFRQIVARRALPFGVKVPNNETIAAIKQSRTMNIVRRKSVKKLFNKLEG